MCNFPAEKMARVLQIFLSLSKKPAYFLSSVRCYTPESSSTSNKNMGDVPGLSTSVVNIPDGDVGPGASKSGEYKNPEYFSYNRGSYHEAEIELQEFRLPQPSNKVPLKP